ncbi:MAG: DEAD/DEAH box helicase [Candidatus Roizmanbacteria bacterium]
MRYLRFGTTWWGEQWLNAFTHIDNSNRLPRGQRYARNGSVTSIQIEQNSIQAKVQGSAMSPYKISITIPLFDNQDTKHIMETIHNNPYYLSKLLRHEIPSQLYYDLKEKNIFLFPRRWSDLKGNCSCPDFALPCKHLASVVYLIANEIDKNPFLVFQLHGVDILKEYEKSTNKLSTYNKHNSLLTLNEVLQTTTNKQDVTQLKFDEIDFTHINDLRKNIFTLLSDTSLFYSSDFKVLLEKEYIFLKRSAKFSTSLMKHSSDVVTPINYHTLTLRFNEKLHLTEGILLAKNNKFHFSKNPQQLLEYLENLPHQTIYTYSPDIQWLWFTYQFTLHLIEKSAFVPQIIELENKNYIVRYIPFLSDKFIRQIFDQLSQYSTSITVKIGKKDILPSQEEQLKLIISWIISIFINEQETKISDDIYKLFFHNKPYIPTSFQQQQIPMSIADWLAKLHLARSDITTLLHIEEGRTENQFITSILIDISKNNIMASPIPLADIFNESRYVNLQMQILHDLAILSEHFPQLETIIASKGDIPLHLTTEEFTQVLTEYLPVIKLLGIRLMLPKGLDAVLRPQLSLRAKKRSNSTIISDGFLSMGKILDFDWQIAIGDTTMDPKEFISLIRKSNGLVKIRDQYVMINDNDLQTLIAQMQKTPHLSSAEALKVTLSEEYKGAHIELSEDIIQLIDELKADKIITVPDQFIDILRPYQERGFQWLYKNSKLGFGSLLADDMGLGKTLQVIALISQWKHEAQEALQPVLIVVPTTLLTNWQREIQRFAPNLRTYIHYGNNRDIQKQDIDVYITTYGLLRTEQHLFEKRLWHAIIIDEAQAIKNHTSLLSKSIKSIKSAIRIAMTGTPVENRLEEYWSINEFLNQGYLGNLKSFQTEFCTPITSNRDQQAISRFHRITSPFILRRLKSDKTIIQDLPEKIEIDQFPQLSKEQAILYQSVLDTIMKDVEKADGIERRGLILKLITSLKQVCNHPSQYLRKNEINPNLSGKLILLSDILQTIQDNGEKTIIFSQYREMGELLSRYINEHLKQETLFLHGGSTRNQRDEMVEQFQKDPYYKIMILSLKAGGTGLNLTSATNVIHYDLWWNPAVEAQATDRAYRIGQKQNVMVHRFITKGTFEEKINAMIQSKKQLANLTIQEGENWIGSLDNQELKELFAI